jgi:hypothetical protein
MQRYPKKARKLQLEQRAVATTAARQGLLNQPYPAVEQDKRIEF